MATPASAEFSAGSSRVGRRSFGGCTTCRNRHVKCDERRPACHQCMHARVRCEGYQKSLFFVSTPGDVSDDESGVVRFRRPLLTEAERKRMSERLTTTVPPKLAASHLSQIDCECENAAPDGQFQVYRGPFGAFRLGQQQPPPVVDSLPDELDEDNSSSIEEIQINSDDLSLSSSVLPLWTQMAVPSDFDLSEEFLVSDFESVMMNSGQVGVAADSTVSLPDIVFGPQILSAVPSEAPGYQFEESTAVPPLDSFIPYISNSYIMSAENTVPQETIFLLKHYTTTVVTSLSPFRHSKTPWHTLFIPHAKSCLAAFILGEQLDHASLTIFYGISAVSAFSISGMFQNLGWLEQGKSYKEKARQHVKLMQRTTYDTPKTSKYKTRLMALLTMVQISIASGNRDQSDCYLLEAEKFIRLRGLHRQKSRKVRLLHHCYAFERFFHETTFLCGGNMHHRHHVRTAVESSGLLIKGQDSLSFRLPSWSNLDQELRVVKNQEEGENDLHLERPGLFSNTLYPEIFGVPEHYIFLLSMVIRLGNEKDAAEHHDTPSSFEKNFFARTKEIEKHIKQLQQPNQTGNLTAEVGSQADQLVLANMLEAMRHALTIYFYRRIYDLDSSMLQQQVLAIRDCLLQCEQATTNNLEFSSTAFTWPAFMAASEAEDPEVQASFSKWFKAAAQQSGLSSVTETLKRIEKIWEEKCEADQERRSVTWLDLMKHSALINESS